MWQTMKGHTILCNEVKSINADSFPGPEVYDAFLFLGMSSSLATTDILYPSSKGALIGLWFALFDFRYWVWKFVEETFGRELASEEEVPWRVLGTEAAAQWSYLTQRQHQGLLQM